MSALIKPRGALPARVYWVRRSLLLGVVFLLVFGIGRLFGGGSDPTPTATQAADTSHRSSGSHASAQIIGPMPFIPSHPSQVPGDEPTAAATTPPAPVDPQLPMPTNPCDPSEITVTPALAAAQAGRNVVIPLDVTGTAPACKFEVTPDSLVVKVTSSGNRIWSTQQCPAAIRSQVVAVRNSGATRINVTWNGGRVDDTCTTLSYAGVGAYEVEAAVIGSEPGEASFRLTKPARRVIVKQVPAKPAAQPTATPSLTVPKSASNDSGGKGTVCGGDIAAGSC